MPENLAKPGFARRQWLRWRPLIARHRRNPLFKGVAGLNRLWLKAYENCNGEEMILRTLAGHGFVIGEIFPAYVEFRDYDFEHELLWGSNYLAVLKNRPDLRKRFPGAR